MSAAYTVVSVEIRENKFEDSKSLDEFSKLCSEKLAQNWTLHGSLQVTNGMEDSTSYTTLVFAQAFVK